MYDTYSKIVTAVLVGLGLNNSEPDLLQESTIGQVVFRSLAKYYEDIRQSDQNLMAEKTSEFTLASGSNTKDLTALTGEIVTPLWCELKIYDGGNDVWEFVPTVNINTLPERRAKGMIAVSFYGDTANQVTAEFSIYGDESSPMSTYRVWYSPTNSFSANKDAALAIPDNLASLVVVDAQLNTIPVLLNHAAKYVHERPELPARMAAWQGMKEDLKLEKMEWTARFEKWVRRSRGAHRAIDHNPILDVQP